VLDELAPCLHIELEVLGQRFEEFDLLSHQIHQFWLLGNSDLEHSVIPIRRPLDSRPLNCRK
jgi:hypothetical protein